MLELNKIYLQDCLEGMKELDDNSIDLVVTSPPYDNLRKYNGFSWNFEGVAKEMFRIIKNGGVVVWVVGDKVESGSKSLTSFKHALYFKEIGFNIYDVIIYKKSSPSPPHKNRYFNSFEYMFILSKSKPITINLLKDRPNKCAGTSSGILTRREKNGTLTTKKSIFINDFGTRNNIWEYDIGNNKSTTDKIAFKHPAIFPEKLVKDHIISWSNQGDIVLDPFMGSGTTAKIAIQTNRQYIGFETNEEYYNLANERINDNKTNILLSFI